MAHSRNRHMCIANNNLCVIKQPQIDIRVNAIIREGINDVGNINVRFCPAQYTNIRKY